ncbi:MAG: hypothetical protein AAGG09_09995 [Pseudomonadota bacterium]
MKKVALAVALSAAASTGFAGGLAEPVVEPEIIVEDTGTAGGWVVPLLLLVLVGAAVAASNN